MVQWERCHNVISPTPTPRVTLGGVYQQLCICVRHYVHLCCEIIEQAGRLTETKLQLLGSMQGVALILVVCLACLEGSLAGEASLLPRNSCYQLSALPSNACD